MSLDKLDRSILEILQVDGRASYAKIGRRLGVSENTVRFRVSRLMKSRVLRRFVGLVDPRMIGLEHSAALMLKVKPSDLDRVLGVLASLREVPHIYQLSGEYDAIAVVMAANMEQLQQTINKIKSMDGVKDVNTLVTIRIVKSDVRYALPEAR